jgi:hypothetical protein
MSGDLRFNIASPRRSPRPPSDVRIGDTDVLGGPTVVTGGRPTSEAQVPTFRAASGTIKLFDRPFTQAFRRRAIFF